MENQQAVWINNPKKAWAWAMEWVEEAKTGSHAPIRRIHEAATKFRDRFYTDGFWSAGAELVYNMLIEAAGMAQYEYDQYKHELHIKISSASSGEKNE